MTDDELKALVASLAVAQVKTEEQLARTDAQLAKTDAQLSKTDVQLSKTAAKIDKLAQMYGGMGNNQGRVAEEFYFNSLKHKPTLNGIRFDYIDKNVTRSKGKIEEEYDLLLVNGADVFVIEVKYHVHPDDIVRLVGRKAENFKKLFPEYAHYRHHLGIATFAINDEVKQQALSQGVTVLQRRGKVFETVSMT
ncbi:MAG: hypothetical protein HQL49_07610 [Gammaproteobacteria bacterium]|nr:hypothetical protein [Gammaproteobacteria bacterium]